MTTTTRPDSRARLSEILTTVGKGTADVDAADALRDVVKAVTETGKPGAVTVTVTVAPPKGGGDHLTVTADVKAKVPRITPPASLFFRDPHTGDLTRNDPNQYAINPVTGEIQ